MHEGQGSAAFVEVEDRNGIQAVRIIGRLDTRSAADARRGLHDAIDSGDGILIVDLELCHVGDATGLGLLVELHRKAVRADRRLHLIAVEARTRRLLRGIRLERLIHAA